MEGKLMKSRRTLGRAIAVGMLAVGLLPAPTYVITVEAAPTTMQQPQMEDVFIQFRSRPGPAEDALVRSVGGAVRHRYTVVDAIAARVPSQALQGLRNNPNVGLVEPDIEAQAVHINYPEGTEIGNAWGVDRLDAEVVQSAGITGNGVRLAIVDSGSGPHLDLNIAAENRLGCIGQSCTPGTGAGYNDDNGHGTHVAGSAAAVAGNQASSPFGGVVGMAPRRP
jgi:subtilisin family serine protease